MDTLAVHATKTDDNRFAVRWRWHQNNTRNPSGGIIHVCVAPEHQEDAPALAELRALYYLLQERQVHGENRKGAGITIEQSFSSVKKALAKKALKSTGMGKTEKRHIAAATEFLATKFFSAKVIAEPKDREFEFKQFETNTIELIQNFPRIKVPCEGFDGGIVISRHALHRQVGRVDQNRHESRESDLSDVDDQRFDAGWVWLTKILAGEKMVERHVRSDVRQRPERYQSARYLYFPDSTPQAVLAVTRDADGCWVLATILRPQQTTKYLDWPPTAMGQTLRRERFI